MSKKKREKFIVLPDGEEVRVVKESGKFYLCDGCQFLKSNPNIKVKTETPKEPDTEESKQKGDE